MKRSLLVLLAFLTGCEKEPQTCCVVMDLDVNFHVVDKNGNNALKNGEADHLLLYYLIDGKEKEVFDSHLDAKRNYSILHYEGDNPLKGEPFLRVFANSVEKSERTTFLLKWKDGRVDSVTTALRRAGPSVWITKVWLNGDLAWSFEIENTGGAVIPRTVKLVKDT